MTGQDEKKPFDLEEQTALFGEAVIEFAKKVPINEITRSLIDQVVRSSTSVGANYCEADDASSKKEFRQKIGYCRKESRETKHWLRMIVKAVPELRENAVAGGQGTALDLRSHFAKKVTSKTAARLVYWEFVIGNSLVIRN